MSEPARAYSTEEDDIQAAPAPLRDWLAALKRYETEERGRLQAPTADNSPWGPRPVEREALGEPTAEQAEAADISELMAENLMLKAKLQVEHERQAALQRALAAQIRELREHIAQEMTSLEELRAEQEAAQAEYGAFRAERETLCQERDKAAAERDAARAEREALASERDGLREDRNLWRARAEALAQPLFQTAKA